MPDQAVEPKEESSTAETEVDNALLKALMRASKKQASFFKRGDVIADQVLRELLAVEGLGKTSITGLASQVLNTGTTAPAVSSLVRVMFDQLVRLEMAKQNAASEKHSSRRTDEDEHEIDKFVTRENRGIFSSDNPGYRCEVPECWKPGSSEYFDDIQAWRSHFYATHSYFWAQSQQAPHNEPPEEDDSQGEEGGSSQEEAKGSWVLFIPRHHPLVESAIDELSACAGSQGVISYKEGCRVLTNIVVDGLYNNDEVSDIYRELRIPLGVDTAPPNALSDFLFDVIERMEEVDEKYKLSLDPRKTPSPLPEPPAHSQMARKVTGSLQNGTGNTRKAQKRTVQNIAAPFRFLDLPAEMRNLIYRELLSPAPGYIRLLTLQYSIKTTDGRPAYSRRTKCQPLVLASCKQAYKEAVDIMYQENTVVICAQICNGNYPIINKRLLPDHVLPKLTSVVLVVENGTSSVANRPDFNKVHWKQLQELTALQELRICMVERKGRPDKEKQWILEHIIERIPASCHISFEARGGVEDGFVQEVLDEWEAFKEHRGLDAEDAIEVDEADLKRIALQAHANVEQGVKSGDPHDYRFPRRGIPQLVPLGDGTSIIDPSIVLGGGGDGNKK